MLKRNLWDGYDAIAETRDAQHYIQDHALDKQPFVLFLSWGTPHAPYQTAPQQYKDLYDPKNLELRPNVPAAMDSMVRADLAGYYAHCTAPDDMVAEILS